MKAAYAYAGSELDLFADATNWKSYFAAKIAPYVGDEVLEVGAGFGGTTRFLCRSGRTRWVCLEPDPELADRLSASIANGSLPDCCQPFVGFLHQLAPSQFDTVLYIDVLEHIEDDAGELALASNYLKPGGHLVVLSPAHPWLYSPFDRAIGHQRRYTRRTLAERTPPGLRLRRLFFLDAVGLLASLGNRLVLNSPTPSRRQIYFWDRFLVRMSKWVDPLFAYTLGKSIVGVWQKSEQAAKAGPPTSPDSPVANPAD